MKPKVVVIIEDGLATLVMTSTPLSDQVEVIIQDYDVVASDVEQIKVDPQGDACIYQLWEEAEFEELSDFQERHIDQQLERPVREQ